MRLEQALQRIASGERLAAYHIGRKSANTPVIAAQFVVCRHVVARRVKREGIVELVLAVVGNRHCLASRVIPVYILYDYRVVAEGHLGSVGDGNAYVGGAGSESLYVELESVVHRDGRCHVEIQKPHLHGFVAHDNRVALPRPVGIP